MILGIKEGNNQVFNEFYAQYVEKLYNYFYYRTQSEFFSDDLTQQTFIKFWQYRHSLNSEIPADVQLYYKARIVYIDWLRKEAYRRKLNEKLSEQPNEVETAGWQNDNHPDTEKLQRAIKTLPEKRRKALSLFYLEGYSYKEIAEMLDISVKTVNNHIYQGLAQLRKILLLLLFFFR